MKRVQRQETDRASGTRSRPGDDPRPLVDKIGRFVIQQSMSAVPAWSTYLALDPVFEQEVLVHVVGDQVFSTATAQAQFEEAAHAAKVLSHPSIVPVVGAGNSDLGPYIVYRHCPGISLDQWLAEQPGPLDGKSAAGLVQCLADAVQHAHQRGILHRALNPTHILIDRPETETEEDSEKWLPTQVRINHYAIGFAQQENEAAENDRLPALAYRSPEERGGEGEIGTTTDIYSLGAILYRLSVGPPPAGPDLRLNEMPAPWPMDDSLQAVCRKCLRDLPAERYPTAFELADELIRCYPDPSTTGRSGRGLKKLLRWPR
ncbi:MAG: protein kinase [Mariniblastus sp.]|nr:protein kinase [Mariniblastus sp.]